MKIRALVFSILALFAFTALPACGGPQKKDDKQEVRDRADDSMSGLEKEERKHEE